MTAEHREQIREVVQSVVEVAKAYDAKGRSSMPIELDEVTALMAAALVFHTNTLRDKYGPPTEALRRFSTRKAA